MRLLGLLEIIGLLKRKAPAGPDWFTDAEHDRMNLETCKELRADGWPEWRIKDFMGDEYWCPHDQLGEHCNVCHPVDTLPMLDDLEDETLRHGGAPDPYLSSPTGDVVVVSRSTLTVLLEQIEDIAITEDAFVASRDLIDELKQNLEDQK